MKIQWLLGLGFIGALALGGCGIITAPFSVAKAVSSNASFTFKGKVVDEGGKPLEGVVVDVSTQHRFWAPLSGSRDVQDHLLRRVDGEFQFDVRGATMEVTFTKDGYQSRNFRFWAGAQNQIQATEGRWPNVEGGEGFPVVMPAVRVAEAPLAKFQARISYENYPFAEAISVPNVATDGRTGEVKYAGKDAEDPTLFPPGTLYLTLDKAPPVVMDAKGNIDPAELDIPNKITLHLPGLQSGLIRIAPTTGYHPLLLSDAAPVEGYVPTLTFERPRLKAMRQASGDNIVGAYEYFFFRAGNRYGKGVLTWATRAGKPIFNYTLYVQKRLEDRNLTLRTAG